MAAGLTPTDPDYWLAYWIAAMDHAAARADKLVILPENRLQADPQRVMSDICERVALDIGDMDFTTIIRPVPPRADRSTFDAALLDRAMVRYSDLAKAAS